MNSYDIHNTTIHDTNSNVVFYSNDDTDSDKSTSTADEQRRNWMLVIYTNVLKSAGMKLNEIGLE